MSLEITINDHLKKAMLAKDEKGLRALRAIKAAILLAKTAEGAGEAMTADAEIKLLQKLVKQRKDSIEIFEQQNRSDLAIKEKEEVEVIEQFLPKQMNAEEIKEGNFREVVEAVQLKVDDDLSLTINIADFPSHTIDDENVQ